MNYNFQTKTHVHVQTHTRYEAPGDEPLVHSVSPGPTVLLGWSLVSFYLEHERSEVAMVTERGNISTQHNTNICQIHSRLLQWYLVQESRK